MTDPEREGEKQSEGQAGGPQAGTGEAAESWGWTMPHRVGLGILVFVFLGLLFVQYLRRPARMGESVITDVGVSGPVMALPTRVNPNTASAAELSRIPHVGPKLAEAIVSYREVRKGVAAEGIVFARIEDVDRVPGVGKTLLGQIEPYLDFPGAATEPAATGPATEPGVQ